MLEGNCVSAIKYSEAVVSSCERTLKKMANRRMRLLSRLVPFSSGTYICNMSFNSTNKEASNVASVSKTIKVFGIAY